MTEQEAINLVMSRKGEVLAATAWEGYTRSGKGVVATNPEGLKDLKDF